MRRRDFIAGLGVAAAWPLVARAQQAAKVLRVGFVGVQPPDAAIYDAFRRRMAELGYQDGRNFAFEYVRTPSIDAYDASFRELAARKPDIMLAAGNEPALRAARAAAGAAPIVFLAIDFDPVERGYVASLARPGGNITGIFVHPLELAAKRIELVREALPAAGLFRRLRTDGRCAGRAYRDPGGSDIPARSRDHRALVARATASFDRRVPRDCRGGRGDDLRHGSGRPLSRRRRRRRPGCQGRQARRVADRAVVALPSGGQPEERDHARHHVAARAHGARRRGDRMTRRELMSLVVGAAAWPLAARAQEPGRTYRLGFLMPAGRQTAAVVAMFDELRLNGFVEGKNLALLPEGFEVNYDHLAERAAAVVNAAPDAIIAGPELPCARFRRSLARCRSSA